MAGVMHVGMRAEGVRALLFPLLHPAKIDMLTKAVLAGNSQDYKPSLLSGSDLVVVWNALNDAAAPVDLHDPTRGGSRERLYRFLQQTAYHQFPMQRLDTYIRLGRFAAMYVDIPNAEFTNKGVHCDKAHLNVPDAFESYTGVPLALFTEVQFRIYALTMQRWSSLYESVNNSWKEWAGSSTVRPSPRQAQTILRSIIERSSWRHDAFFTARDLQLGTDEARLLDGAIESLTLMARTTSELRQLLRQRPYNLGFLAHQLSPLRRYPIVAVGHEHANYVVPFVSLLDMSMGTLPHYLLLEQESIRERFYTSMGRAQEIYLQRLVADRLPQLRRVPEREWPSAKGKRRGPDLVLLDPTSGTCVVVESKARRFGTDVRVEDGDEALRRTIDDAIRALHKIPEKLAELRQGLDIYSDVQEAINASLRQPPIGVVVMGETLEFLTESVHEIIRDNSSTPKNDGYFLVVGLEIFEEMVETAMASGDSLYQVLADYYEDSSRPFDERVGSNQQSASLRGRERPDPQSRFASRYVHLVLPRDLTGEGAV